MTEDSFTSLVGRTIIVTGVASGIGRAIALLLAERGANLAMTDRSEDAGKELLENLKAKFPSQELAFEPLDLQDVDGIARLVETFNARFKRLDGLANCAGANIPSPIAHEVDDKLWEITTNVNQRAVWLLQKHFIAAVLGKKGKEEAPAGGYSIVTVGSMASLQGGPTFAAYVGTKHAVLGYTRAISKEYATENIRVNLVAPGNIETPMFNQVISEDKRAAVVDSVPMKRMGEAVEIAKAVAFLLSSEASYITGAYLPVDGGVTA
ncbi:SDR family NAD(P)-dependent oxidoreductase [Rhodotorula paludigena]|uniref:SDR family NAD(P)-dependent oxidoreductase n=1 Tax=Rhodotorula paludigena TaxID=86838 RepID=UPI0031742999